MAGKVGRIYIHSAADEVDAQDKESRSEKLDLILANFEGVSSPDSVIG